MIKERRRGVAKQLIRYAEKYGQILDTGNASELLTLSPKNRQHAMRALANLSKYYGCYDEWKAIKQNYDLRWTTDNDMDAFNAITDSKHNYTAMLTWLKDVCSKIPQSYANILFFDTLTGSRPDEACQSIHLLKSGADNYLNNERQILEHFNYKQIFIRRTKKAYISLVTPTILELAMKAEDCGYNALRLVIKRRGLDMHMGYCLKIFSTHLRTKGIAPELIDLLQGRIPKVVFARHYFRPDFVKEVKRMRKMISSLLPASF